ncbi:MAG TPA: peptidase M15 [Pseudonocardiaceae bacterium]
MRVTRSRLVVALIAAVGAMAVFAAAPAAHAAQAARMQAGCTHQTEPPPPVDSSEAPAPGATTPAPLPVPDSPVGGARMGECGLILPADAPTPPAGINAQSWLIADADSGEVLAARDPHARNRPASTLKLFTSLLVADQLPFDRVVVGTQADADQDGSRVGIGPGGRYTVQQLLAGLFLASGNDAVHALAVQMGGMASTVKQINELAARLGALDTRAATPSGLDGPGMSSSAYDLALAFRRVLHEPRLVQLLGTRLVNFPGYGKLPGFLLSNDNRLLGTYPGSLGGKTGFTDDARQTQVDAAQRGGRRLLVVLMRGERAASMAEQAANLLSYGFALPPGHPVGRLVNESEVPAATPAAPGPDPGAGPSTTNASHDAGIALPVAWFSIAVVVLAGLAALVARQRHR